MRVLVTWGSKRGGTEGIARILGEALESEGMTVDLQPADQVRRAAGYDAVIIGGSVYANHWHPDARRFITRHLTHLRAVPVWCFSSGPLDASADERVIPPTPQVEALMERVGAQGHATFGGRLSPDAQGFPASAMARKHAGDWRNPERIAAWAREISRALPSAQPRPPIVQPGRSVARLALHGVVGWAACAAIMAALLRLTGLGTALVLHALAAPVVFALVAHHYFRARGARAPLPTAFAFVGIALVLDAVVVAGLIQRSTAMLGSLAGTWVPLVLVFGVTWLIGEIRSMMPVTGGPPLGPPHPAARST